MGPVGRSSPSLRRPFPTPAAEKGAVAMGIEDSVSPVYLPRVQLAASAWGRPLRMAEVPALPAHHSGGNAFLAAYSREGP